MHMSFDYTNGAYYPVLQFIIKLLFLLLFMHDTSFLHSELFFPNQILLLLAVDVPRGVLDPAERHGSFEQRDPRPRSRAGDH